MLAAALLAAALQGERGPAAGSPQPCTDRTLASRPLPRPQLDSGTEVDEDGADFARLKRFKKARLRGLAGRQLVAGRRRLAVQRCPG